MTRARNKGDATLEPDSLEDNRSLSDEWPSDNGALISVTIDVASWHALLVDDLKTRGPAMLDRIAACLSVEPPILSLLLCDDNGMREINHMYRGFDNATNVLSFPAGDDFQWASDVPAKEITIGDVAIAAETVVREASEAGIAAGDHLLHLFTHGVLHLLGYDHDEDNAASKMEGLEIDLLAQMKIANPYCGGFLGSGTRELG